MTKTILPVLAAGSARQTLDNGTQIWTSQSQPWLNDGITLQYSSSRYNQGRSVAVACDALDSNTGEVLASTSHPACTNDAVRRILRERRQMANAA